MFRQMLSMSMRTSADLFESIVLGYIWEQFHCENTTTDGRKQHNMTKLFGSNTSDNVRFYPLQLTKRQLHDM